MDVACKTERNLCYQIVVEGALDADWGTWFSDLVVDVGEDVAGRPVTTLTGPVADQAALRSILNKVWDLNLTLISVKRAL